MTTTQKILSSNASQSFSQARSFSTPTRAITFLEDVALEDFIENHLIPNEPLLLGPKLSENWPCLKNWTVESRPYPIKQVLCQCGNLAYLTSPELCQSNCPYRVKSYEDLRGLRKIPNFSYLKEKFGGSEVNVTDCETRDFNSTKTRSTTVSSFIEEWEKIEPTCSFPSDQVKCFPKTKLYLKDWHFQIDYPDYSPYEVPEIFQEDWMDLFWIHRTDLSKNQENETYPPWRDDHRFVYMGSAGSFTPFHTDVLNSYSWSTNLCGIKKWYFLPPSEKSKWTSGSTTCFDLRDASTIGKDFPSLLNYNPIVVYQFPGETIFVPSGWGHQVINLTNVISVNQNWSNGYNSPSTIDYLNFSLKEVQQSIADCEPFMQDPFEFESHCQVLLKCHAGINHIIWYQWLYWVLKRELSFLTLLLPEKIVIQISGLFPPLICPDDIRVLSQHEFSTTPIKHIRYFKGKLEEAAFINCFRNINSISESLMRLTEIDQKSLDYLSNSLMENFYELNTRLQVLKDILSKHKKFPL